LGEREMGPKKGEKPKEQGREKTCNKREDSTLLKKEEGLGVPGKPTRTRIKGNKYLLQGREEGQKTQRGGR